MTDNEISSEEDVIKWRLKMMTTQRFTNLMELADILGDMGADGIEVIRKIGRPENEHLRQFLREGKPATFKFLAGLREEEVNELGNAIENARAFRRGGKILRWSVVTLFGTFVGISVIWDKFAAWIKVTR